MPGLTHIGIAFMVQLIAPNIPIWALLLATEFLDIICIILYILGIEKIPTKENAPIAPYSHGLFMALIWTLIASFITWFISNDTYTTFIIGGLVFSHWILDFIASPMTYAYPNDTGKPIFFQNSCNFFLISFNDLLENSFSHSISKLRIKSSPLKIKSK